MNSDYLEAETVTSHHLLAQMLNLTEAGVFRDLNERGTPCVTVTGSITNQLNSNLRGNLFKRVGFTGKVDSPLGSWRPAGSVEVKNKKL